MTTNNVTTASVDRSLLPPSTSPGDTASKPTGEFFPGSNKQPKTTPPFKELTPEEYSALNKPGQEKKLALYNANLRSEIAKTREELNAAIKENQQLLREYYKNNQNTLPGTLDNYKKNNESESELTGLRNQLAHYKNQNAKLQGTLCKEVALPKTPEQPKVENPKTEAPEPAKAETPKPKLTGTTSYTETDPPPKTISGKVKARWNNKKPDSYQVTIRHYADGTEETIRERIINNNTDSSDKWYSEEDNDYNQKRTASTSSNKGGEKDTRGDTEKGLDWIFGNNKLLGAKSLAKGNDKRR